MDPVIAVLVASHNSDRTRLGLIVDALMAQSLPAETWELVIVDNGSVPALDIGELRLTRHPRATLVREPTLGLVHARLAGIRSSRADLVAFCDDDQRLAPDYLERAVERFAADPRLGNAAGRSIPQFEITPPDWIREFDICLALRPGSNAVELQDGWNGSYPSFVCGGGGAVFRRQALDPFVRSIEENLQRVDLRGRTGTALTSGEDNHIVLELLRAGWRAGYFPELVMHHMIPKGRTTVEYLGRLNHDIASSWVAVLDLHGICPWTHAPRWTLPLRKLRSYWRERAWVGGAEYVRWRYACGLFDGRAAIGSSRGRARA